MRPTRLWQLLFLIWCCSVFNACCNISGDQVVSTKTISALPDKLQRHPDLDWILKILKYESERGSQWGTGLAHWGNYMRKPCTLTEAVTYFIKDYLPRVAAYPRGLRERLGDYFYNTGRRPEDLLLYNAGLIGLDQINSKQDFRPLWQKEKERLQAFYSDSIFVNRLDSSKDQVYRTTKTVDGNPNVAYQNTWKPRTWMWGTFSPSRQPK
ncbi:MAG: hypothetical protein ACKO6Q_06660 [Bacteroidota bacterium]